MAQPLLLVPFGDHYHLLDPGALDTVWLAQSPSVWRLGRVPLRKATKPTLPAYPETSEASVPSAKPRACLPRGPPGSDRSGKRTRCCPSRSARGSVPFPLLVLFVRSGPPAPLANLPLRGY
eukprot:6199680-Pleurochrysis_carterae.AAC.2